MKTNEILCSSPPLAFQVSSNNDFLLLLHLHLTSTNETSTHQRTQRKSLFSLDSSFHKLSSKKQNNLADASFFCHGHLIFPFIQLKKRSINSQCLFFSASIFEPEFTVTQFLGYICRWSIKNLIFGPILGPKRTWTAPRRTILQCSFPPIVCQ